MIKIDEFMNIIADTKEELILTQIEKDELENYFSGLSNLEFGQVYVVLVESDPFEPTGAFCICTTKDDLKRIVLEKRKENVKNIKYYDNKWKLSPYYTIFDLLNDIAIVPLNQYFDGLHKFRKDGV